MRLIGMLDSPFVRRVAISAKLLQVPFEHQSLSVFRNYDEFAKINPTVKAPTLICEDGTVLVDSTLILEHLEELSAKSLVPAGAADRLLARSVIGAALVACEKTVQIYYEQTLRPETKRHQPWLDRVIEQLQAAYQQLESVAQQRRPWIAGEAMSQADVTVAVAWRFTQFVLTEGGVDAGQFPAMKEFSAEMEQLPAFTSTPLD